jgi:hypothetical protein
MPDRGPALLANRFPHGVLAASEVTACPRQQVLLAAPRQRYMDTPCIASPSTASGTRIGLRRYIRPCNASVDAGPYDRFARRHLMSCSVSWPPFAGPGSSCVGLTCFHRLQRSRNSVGGWYLSINRLWESRRRPYVRRRLPPGPQADIPCHEQGSPRRCAQASRHRPRRRGSCAGAEPLAAPKRLCGRSSGLRSSSTRAP